MNAEGDRDEAAGNAEGDRNEAAGNAEVGAGAAAAEPHETVVELDELLNQPGTYFNPQTEVVVVVDDSASLDQEIFNMEAYEGAEWVRISDDVPLDEEGRDELLEDFQTHYHPGSGGGSLSAAALEQDDGEEDEDEPGQDPGRED